MSSRCLERLNGIIHGANIDLKSFSDDFYKNLCDGRLKPVLKKSHSNEKNMDGMLR